jgi:Tol biopolymer transport system component
MSRTRSGSGYWLFTSVGRSFNYGDAPNVGDLSAATGGAPLQKPIIDSSISADGNGVYMVALDGGVFALKAPFFGSAANLKLAAPVRSLVPDPAGTGYWLIATDGGVFGYNAAFRGSMGGKRLNAPVAGMVAYGNGYLQVAADGGVFNFSDLAFSGSLGGQKLTDPIVAIAAFSTPSTTGSTTTATTTATTGPGGSTTTSSSTTTTTIPPGAPCRPFPLDALAHQVTNTSPGAYLDSRMSSSSDGCTVAFESAADLAPRDARTVPGGAAGVRDPNNADDSGPVADTTNNNDIFVWTARDNQIRRITAGDWFWDINNVDRNGGTGLYGNEHATANGASVSPSISADGRYLAFTSRADYPGLDGQFATTQTSPTGQVHKYGIWWMDLQSGQLVRIENTRAGEIPTVPQQYPVQITGNGQRVVFQQASHNSVTFYNQIYIWDRASGIQRLVSAQYDGTADGNGWATSPTVSSDGSVVAFQSVSTNLVGPGGGAIGLNQIYLWVDSGRALKPCVSGDVYCDDRFHSPGPNNGTITRLTAGDRSSNWPRLSSDGTRVAFTSYANLDGAANHTLLGVNLEGEGFTNPAAGDLFVYTRAGAVLRRITNGARGSAYFGVLGGNFSADGRFISFQSTSSAPVLGGGDTTGSGAFVYDLTNSSLITGNYASAAAGSVRPYVTPDGRTLYYWTDNGSGRAQLFGRSLN